MKHFLDISQVSKDCIKSIIKEAKNLKESRRGFPNGTRDNTAYLDNRIVALIFEKPSTRTRISFDVGIRQMGGESMIF